jgi:hypothetical protein
VSASSRMVLCPDPSHLLRRCPRLIGQRLVRYGRRGACGVPMCERKNLTPFAAERRALAQTARGRHPTPSRSETGTTKASAQSLWFVECTCGG